MTEKQALKVGDRLSGLGVFTKIIKATHVPYKDDTTPFLAQRLNYRESWRIDYEHVSLRLPSQHPDVHDPYSRTISVWIDSQTSQLLRIESLFDGKDKDLHPMASAREAEPQLKEHDEIYHSLPALAPHLNFVEVLDLVLSSGVGAPPLAKEFRAYFVIHSYMGSPDHRAVWIVTLNGLPPFPGHGYAATLPAWQRNQMRNVIDDKKKQVLFSTNVPTSLSQPKDP